MTKEAMKLALEALEQFKSQIYEELYHNELLGICEKTITAIKEVLAQPEQEPVTLLPDGSAFGVISFPLPDSHWLYAEREYRDGEHEPIELGKPILTHELRDAVVSAVRYAIRGATNCGKEMDFDPDALVQNAVYALCGPYTRHVDDVNMSQERVDETAKGEHEPVACKHSRYSVDAHEQTGNCYDCGAEGRMKFVVADAPPQRTWVGLTDDDRRVIYRSNVYAFDIIQATEARLKQKNGYAEEKNT